MPFAGKFRIIDFTLSNCVNSGIRKIGVATQYKAHSLIRHIQRGWSFLDGRFDEFVQRLPAQQQIDEIQWYQGTADAVFQNLHVLRRYQPERMLVVAGDHIYKMDYGQMLAIHARNQADMTVVCIDVALAEASEFGIIAVNDEDRVIDFVEKPKNPPAMLGQPDRARLFSNLKVHSWATVEDAVILPEVDIGRHAIVKRCVIDKHCRIPEGMVIGVDLAADRQRFHVSPKGITLVTAEMLGQGAAANC